MNIQYLICNKCNCQEKTSFLDNRRSITFSNISGTKENNTHSNDENSSILEIIEYPYSNNRKKEVIPFKFDRMNFQIDKNFDIFKEIFDRSLLLKETSNNKYIKQKDKDNNIIHDKLLINSLFKNFKCIQNKRNLTKNGSRKKIKKINFTYEEKINRILGIKDEYPHQNNDNFLEKTKNNEYLINMKTKNKIFKNNTKTFKKSNITKSKSKSKSKIKINLNKNLYVKNTIKNKSNKTLYKNKSNINFYEKNLFYQKLNSINSTINNNSIMAKSIRNEKTPFQNKLIKKEYQRTLYLSEKDKIHNFPINNKISNIENYKKLFLIGNNKQNSCKKNYLSNTSKAQKNKNMLRLKKIKDKNQDINYSNKTYINPFSLKKRI